LVLALLCSLLLAAPAPVALDSGPVVVIHLDGIVQPISAEYIQRGIAWANRRHARAVVLEMNTPGGLDTSMRAIIQSIYASAAPVIAYVAPSGARAASAGFFLLMSCDVAAMAPGTNTGAAHPVMLGGGTPDKTMMTKIENDASAYMRSLAADHHRNLDLAQSAVLQSKSFSQQEALDDHLIDLVAPSLDSLLHQLDGRAITRPDGRVQILHTTGAPIDTYGMSLREQLLNMDPNFAFLMLAAGVLLLGIEFTHPGVVAPGVIGVILLFVALFSLSYLPINWAAAGLILLGFVLIALEGWFPTHGILTVGGVVALTIGAVFLIDTPIPAMRIRLSVAGAAALTLGGISALLLRLVLRVRRRKPVTGREGLIGEHGVVRSPLTPEGMVLVHGELWRARSHTQLPAGSDIRVRQVHGLLLEVEPEVDPQVELNRGNSPEAE
jgi:membrane-bound serine protease (ClpP class)